ncbi:Hypothetical predicted protein [Pelobates cultripes]|uniref:Uncharacterized protein n=1 Tax=Pelobates cultripes TaxID=61616 RepID=A0AAD1RFV5_PELCU|nr:Hypothetical predicted protein [Pelobates cultripes]
MRAMMAELSTTIQATITTQLKSLVTDLHREIQELGQRKAHVESKMDEYAIVHNSLADKLQELDGVLEAQQIKLAYLEESSRKNNLRIRGTPEEVTTAHLPNYLMDLFQALTPEIHPDQLIVDRAHRLAFTSHPCEGTHNKGLQKWGPPRGSVHPITTTEEGLQKLGE